VSSTLKVTSLPDAVYEALRESIVTLETGPGSLVTETAIAMRYTVARPTAKAALERLVADGLLRREAHRAARVPELSRADIEDIYANRTLIEVEALRALATEAVIPEPALSAHRDLIAHAQLDDRAALVQDDIAFHRALVLGQGSPRLARMHQLIMGEVELCIGQVQSHHLMTPNDIAEQHQAILDAVSAGDRTLAGELTLRHIGNARDRLLRKYDSDHTPKEA
jgi:DNA-binding GntR family transcriptional regulator